MLKKRIENGILLLLAIGFFFIAVGNLIVKQQFRQQAVSTMATVVKVRTVYVKRPFISYEFETPAGMVTKKQSLNSKRQIFWGDMKYADTIKAGDRIPIHYLPAYPEASSSIDALTNTFLTNVIICLIGLICCVMAAQRLYWCEYKIRLKRIGIKINAEFSRVETQKNWFGMNQKIAIYKNKSNHFQEFKRKFVENNAPFSTGPADVVVYINPNDRNKYYIALGNENAKFW